MPTVTRKQYEAIDLVKFICSLFIVAAHIAPLGGSEKYSAINQAIGVYTGRFPVIFFFIANGFFLFRNSTYETFDLKKAKGFIIKILTLYGIWTLIHLPLNIYWILHNEEGILHGVLGYVRNVLFYGSYTQLWYLHAAMVGMIILAFLLSRKWKVRNILLLGTFLYILGLLGQSWFGLIRPLLNACPPLYTALKLVQKVIYTTSDGIFEGFPCIAIGMVIAWYPKQIKMPLAVLGLIVSYVLYVVEIWFVNTYHFSRGADIHITLIPTAIFLFVVAKNIPLKNHKIYLRLRQMSSLFFYMHMFVGDILSISFRHLAGIEIHMTLFKYPLTIGILTILSLAIIHLSENNKHFRFLKAIY